MAAIMDDTHGTKKHEYDKIALLGLFILSLLFANTIVSLKSRLSFSDPIRLYKTDLSVSMPSGRNWQSEEQWNYQDNMFSLSSLFPRGSERPTAWANCRYLLSAETATPQMRFEQRASAIDAVVTETNQIQTDTLTFDWARIDIPELHFNMFFGTTRLPDNRQLDIEVSQIAGEAELTERIFERIIETLEFQDNRLLKDGTEIVAEIKLRGIENFLNNQNRQTSFLIQNENKQKIGFTMDAIVDFGSDIQPNIRTAGLFYIMGQSSLEQGTSFQCSNNLDEFVYTSSIISRQGRNFTETILEKDGTITVRNTKIQPDKKNCQIGPAMIPDVFLDQLLMQMLDSKKSQIIIDLIEANGKIIPTFLAEIEASENMTSDEDASYIFELEFLDGRGFSEQLFLNDQKQVYKRLARQDKIYILERTSAENIASEFPEYAERVLQYNSLLR